MNRFRCVLAARPALYQAINSDSYYARLQSALFPLGNVIKAYDDETSFRWREQIAIVSFDFERAAPRYLNIIAL